VGEHLERTQVEDRTVEYPRVDPLCAGARFRHGYCLEMAWEPDAAASPLDGSPRIGPLGILKFDLERQVSASWQPGPGRRASEPLFVRALDGHGDDEGWLLTVVSDANRDASDLYVLDASALGRRKPEAVIHLPQLLPFRSHGEWVPADQYR
jgi:carotenoid cleavage dioxygenase